MSPAPVWTAVGAHGVLSFDSVTGAVLRAERCACADCAAREDGVTGYGDIARIDITELAAEFPTAEHGGELDILEVGYWTRSGHYEPPADSFREWCADNAADDRMHPGESVIAYVGRTRAGGI